MKNMSEQAEQNADAQMEASLWHEAKRTWAENQHLLETSRKLCLENERLRALNEQMFSSAARLLAGSSPLSVP